MFLLWSPCTSLASLIIILIINIFYQPLLSNQIYLKLTALYNVYKLVIKTTCHMMLLLLWLLLFVYQLLLLVFLFVSSCAVFRFLCQSVHA